jgi:hypothetical protein
VPIRAATKIMANLEIEISGLCSDVEERPANLACGSQGTNFGTRKAHFHRSPIDKESKSSTSPFCDPPMFAPGISERFRANSNGKLEFPVPWKFGTKQSALAPHSMPRCIAVSLKSALAS